MIIAQNDHNHEKLETTKMGRLLNNKKEQVTNIPNNTDESQMYYASEKSQIQKATFL